ncbi:ATP-binding cassette sub- E member 1 [Paramecium bursaria]
METSKLRIAIINKDRCKPQRCALECKKCCPVNKQEKLCIEVTKQAKICVINESLCIGCALCVKKCPFKAIEIINLPRDLSTELTHQYGQNSFKLHRLPIPRPGQVLGLVGTNGIGKSTALQILSGKVKPNLGLYNEPPDWDTIIKYFKGNELQTYFQKLQQDKIKAVIKPQYVDIIAKQVKGIVGNIIQQKDKFGRAKQLSKELQLDHLLERQVSQLSGGELQRFAILIACISESDVIMFDEPTSYLDIKQRIVASRVIRSQLRDNNYIICVEHDLSILDYLSDFICCLYGVQCAYGIVTMPFGVREGINVFLAGFIPTENMRFRDYELSFKIADNLEKEEDKKIRNYQYPDMKKVQGEFSLEIQAGHFNNSQIVVLLGENGTGKTTFIKMLAGKDPEMKDVVPELSVSYKPQMIAPTFDGTVQQLFTARLQNSHLHPQFQTDVYKPLKIDDLIDNEVKQLSGGELQRVALILALGKPAEVYLLDEPSAYLDAEQRVTTSRLIKRFIMNTKRAGFVVEHDFIMATYLADRVVVYEGEPGKACFANKPQELVPGMNKFLGMLGITFRRDPTNYRPRINKLDSILDKEQKLSGNYFCLDE